MSLKDKERLNLCFDMRDLRQKAVFNYLSSGSKRKTAIVVDSILESALNKKNANLAQKEPISFEEQNQVNSDKQSFDKEMNEIHKTLKQILEKLNSAEITQSKEYTNLVNKATSSNEPDDYDEDDEYALDAMLSVFGS